MSTRTHTIVDSPVGELTLVADDGALCGLYLVQHRRRPDDELGERDPAPFAEAIRQLGEYFARERTEFDLPLAPRGDDFRHRVWALLREIPYGQTRSYGELARHLGNPGLAQAVGAANGANPISIVVPCHRVVGADGRLTGYAGGLGAKRHLLALEEPAADTVARLF